MTGACGCGRGEIGNRNDFSQLNPLILVCAHFDFILWGNVTQVIILENFRHHVMYQRSFNSYVYFLFALTNDNELPSPLYTQPHTFIQIHLFDKCFNF